MVELVYGGRLCPSTDESHVGDSKTSELVEDPGQSQLSVKEDRAREERGHGPQGVSPAYSDADDTDDTLERFFAEEMDAMDSSSDNGSDDNDEFLDVDGGIEEKVSCTNELGKFETASHDKGLSEDASANLEWLQFMDSTEGMLQYMEEATATIKNVSGSIIASPSEEKTKQYDMSGGVDDQEQGHSSLVAPRSPSSNKARFEPATLPEEVLPLLSCANTTNLTATTEPLKEVGIFAPDDSIRSDTSAPDRPGYKEVRASEVKQAGINESDATVGLARISTEMLMAVESSPPPSPRGSPGRHAEPQPHEQSSAEPPSTVLAADILSPSPSNRSATGDSPVQNVTLSLVDERRIVFLEKKSYEPELRLASRVLEASHASTSQQEVALLDQANREFACFEVGIPVIADVLSQVRVMASVGETEVEQRIGREKARCVEARQQRRRDSIAKARREGCLVAFQAAWRGRRARAKVAPALAVRRRELEERRRMFEEERLAECVVALEAERREVEAKLQVKELNGMRCEETRTREAWLFQRRLEETARGEELVRMRAEERFTRALLDLELQDLQRLERARREAEETLRMRSEDQVMRNLRRLEQAQVAEREAMRVEDELARTRKQTEECELAFSRAEESRMAVEDRSSSAWNAEYRRLQEARLRQAWARSTPIQRAMDPKGVAAAQALVCPSPTVSNRRDPLADGTESGTGLKPSLSSPSGGKRPLTQERARRRECCKSHLERISSCALLVRSGLQARATGLEKTLQGYGRKRDARGVSGEGAPLREGQVSPREERSRPVERDGEECELTVDMLSHLGPLQDLTALELCVEGLTSARLLKACTSLKSLSLNVNRLSSPAGLVVSTSLVRLGLRDNRLSSLEGLSGLPSLRELRLDINHLTSLHELKQLPALVELSANTNHIRELPEEFAIGLMSPQDPVVDRTKPGSTLVEKAVACGGLQKLELYHNRIASVHPRALQGLASLTHLDLGRNQLRTLDGRALESCPALSTLVLSQNLLQEPPSPLCLPLLNELWLSGNQISGMGAWAPCPTQGEARPSMTCSPQRAIVKGASTEASGDPTEGGPGASRGNQGVRSSELSERDSEGRRVTKPGRATRGKGSHNALAGGERDNDTGEIGVWLPSLEVLHLQDNSLESLGGVSTFVGCPLLRSFDASFNQLRTPGEIGVSLQACSELEEVRLHDNPASSCQNYTDAVALSCPKLTRMDGVQLDTKVHWRAGASTYGARADLVLPFLLSTDESHQIRGTDERARTSVSEPKVPSATELDEACPWCGARTPSEDNTSASANDSIGGARIVGAGSEAGGFDSTSHGGESPRPTRCTIENYSRSSRRRACASCGFSFPDTDLWAVPASLVGHFPFSWEDVCSAGDRWRGEVCPAPGTHDALETNPQEEEEEEDDDIARDFRAACLRGREERASTRRRHRREERDLAARADLNGAEPRSMNLGGDSTSRLATMAPSRRRLEVELDLGQQQAEERRDQAARQLCFHAGGTDVGSIDRNQSKRTTGRGDTERSRVHQSHQTPGHRRNRAARVIQRRWHRRQERAAPSRLSLEDGTTRPAKEQAVMKLQSVFRGFHVRRALQAALDSAKYVDDEVEGLLSVDGGARFELDRFLSPPPELTDGWWGTSSSTSLTVPRPTKDVPRRPAPPGGDRASGTRLMGTARAVFSNTSTLSNARDGHAVETTRQVDKGSPPRFGRGSEAHVGVNGPRPPESPRTPTGTDQGAKEAAENSNGKGSSVKATDSVREDGGEGGAGWTRAGEMGLARAWGLKDPSVARAMVKRAKRMRKFQNGEARREKMKNPDVRFDAFAKNAGEHRTVGGAAMGEPGSASAGSSRVDRGGRLNARGNQGARGYGSRAQAGSPRLAPIADTWGKGATSDGAVTTIEPVTEQSIRTEGLSRPPPLKPQHRSTLGGNLVSQKTRGGRPRAALLCAHNLDEEVLFESGPRLAGGERRAGVG